ncbi:GH92 family glycosyl hydrolase [Agaribacter flavus]|uniref:GH92 family glycosyl hydrolase n=1 Tax=Agaribacter flavus TaxID=1902781 RepID=A0ABV7FN96_9ALTE
MKNRTVTVLLALLTLSGCNKAPTPSEFSTHSMSVRAPVNLVDSTNLVQYVNPLIGTDSEFILSNGNTYPALARPWGMNFWTPMTSKMGDGWTYKYDEYTIRGFKQTHQPSPWLNDYAAFSFMPVTGELKFEEEARASWFSHKAETVQPHYYSVYLADYDVVTEITPTERAAQFRFTFPETQDAYILLDAFHKGSHVKVIPEERKIIGYARNNHGGVPENFHNYFVAYFDKDFTLAQTWTDDWELAPEKLEQEGDHVGAIVKFSTKRGEQVNVKVASSFISLEQAELNLAREIGQDDFDTTKQKGFDVWQKELSKIQIESADLDKVKTFYSSLYRLLLFPRSFYEFDENDSLVHYSPYNGEVLPGYMYTDNGFWDTFRAVFPFFTIMYPSFNDQVMQGLVNTYNESGWLPEWASPGHRGVMIGSNSAINIADAYIKGMRNYDADILLEAVLKNANVEEGRPVSSVGREGLNFYNELGYVPYDVGIHENAARTLEYAFADFNIAQMATAMGKHELAQKFYKQSLNYKHLFDSDTGWMRGKNADGSFQSPFNPLKWGDAFTEGNALHYTWSVFHDVQGLIDLMGGEAAFIDKLDEVFTMPPLFDDSYYGFTIHEIREMQIVNMGNYAHGNQPIQHMIYLYNHARQPYKAQARLREVMTKLYLPTPDGYAGDEDNGQTSAWYVLSALGFYSVTPGVPQYVIGSPLFDKVSLQLENGNTVEITAHDNSSENVYIKNMTINDLPHNKSWISHETLTSGAKIDFYMQSTPNKGWATASDSVPYSMSLHLDSTQIRE